MAKILLAEDDESMRSFLKLALERAGHTVAGCPDGLSALSQLEANRGHDARADAQAGAQSGKTAPGFDLLLADIVMPGIDGIELAHKAQTLCPDLKVMYITGFAGIAMEHHDTLPHQTRARVLSKPFHLNELVGQVEAMLAE